MKIRKRDRIAPLYMRRDDTIVLEYYGKEVLESRIGRDMTIEELVIFDVEPGEFGENVKDGIGGAFLDTT